MHDVRELISCKYLANPNGGRVESKELVRIMSHTLQSQYLPVALCNLEQGYYHFEQVHLPEFDFLLREPITLHRFEQLVCSDDRWQLKAAKNLLLRHHDMVDPTKVDCYALVFECRICDQKGGYHNMVFKYQITGTLRPDQQPALVLILFAVDRPAPCPPPEAIYIVDTIRKEIVASEGKDVLDEKELMLVQHINRGLQLTEFYPNLSRSYSSAKRYHSSIFDKLGLKSDVVICATLNFMELLMPIPLIRSRQ